MSISYVKSKGAYRFTFRRIINGKTIRATKLLPKGWSSAEADEWGQKEIARLYAVHSGIGPHSRPTIEAAVLIYLEEHCGELKTQSDYIEEYARLYEFYNGKTFDELPAVCAAINKLPIAPATRRKKIRMLSAACNYGYKYHGMGDSTPSERVVLPKVQNARTVIPTRAEVLRIARKCNLRAGRAGILAAYYSGMRAGEIRKAKAEDGLFKLYNTKNGETRFVPIHPKLKPYLKYFPLRIAKGQLYWAWKHARDQLGLSHLHFHDMRHSAATEMLNNGADLKTVGGVLGHKDPRSTNIYAHLLTSTLARAVALIGMSKKYTPESEETTL